MSVAKFMIIRLFLGMLCVGLLSMIGCAKTAKYERCVKSLTADAISGVMPKARPEYEKKSSRRSYFPDAAQEKRHWQAVEASLKEGAL